MDYLVELLIAVLHHVLDLVGDGVELLFDNVDIVLHVSLDHFFSNFFVANLLNSFRCTSSHSGLLILASKCTKRGLKCPIDGHTW